MQPGGFIRVAVCAGAVAGFLALAAAAPPNGASGHGLSAAERGRAAVRPASLVAVPVESFVALPRSGVPPAGEASASGCAAARAYLAAYAAPGFAVRCPGYADGHQAATMCVSASSTCGTDRIIPTSPRFFIGSTLPTATCSPCLGGCS